MAIMSINDILDRSEEAIQCAINSYKMAKREEKREGSVHRVLWIWYTPGHHAMVVKAEQPHKAFVKVVDIPLTHIMTEPQVEIFLRSLARSLPLINRRTSNE